VTLVAAGEIVRAIPTARHWTSGNKIVLPLILVAAANLLIKVPLLGRDSIWLDEAVSLHASFLPFSAESLAASDWTPPLYHLMLTCWTRIFGSSIETARLLSVLFSTATAVAVYHLAANYVNAYTAAVATALYTTATIQLRYATEARSYALVGLLCVISFELFIGLVRRPTIVRTILLGVVNAALLYTHYVAGFIVLTQLGSIVAARVKLLSLVRCIQSAIITAVAFAPWLIVVIGSGEVPHTEWIQPPTIGAVRYVLKRFAGTSELLILFVCVIIAAAVLGRVADRKGAESPTHFVLVTIWCWIAVPLALAFVASFLYQPMFVDRYVLYSSIGLYLLVALSAASLPIPRGWSIVIELAMVVGSIGGAVYKPMTRYDWRAAVQKAREEQEAGATIIIAPEYQFRPFAYYYDNNAFQDVHHTKDRILRRGVQLVSDIGESRITTPRAVLILGPEASVRPERAIQVLDESGYQLVSKADLNGLNVLVLER
jgi:mannosyltransferase